MQVHNYETEKPMLELRTVLNLDALASGGLGAGLVVLAGVLEEPLGLPVTVSVVVGAFLVAWAGFVAWAARQGSATSVKEIVAINAAYAVASVVFAVGAWVNLTVLGVAFVLLQAAAVVALTLMQVAGLREARNRDAVPV
jgi:hypothetical protein